MEPVLEVIFSFSEDYNYLNQQVCSEFRQMIPKVLPSSYLNQLIKDDKTPEKFRPCQRLLDIALERDLVYLLQACKDYVPDNICKLSIKKKSVKILKWALDNGYPRDARLFRIAIKHTNFVALPYLRISGCEWDSWACSRAAKEGYLRILKWLRENGCPWDKWTCIYAARYGHLRILQWARANGCPWDESTCEAAAKGGHLEVLQWARANGCPWNGWVLEKALCNFNYDVLQWAQENGCPKRLRN
ncbi:ankyrin repeat [Cedratvirus lausannensis]|uniref:Ankyrin repeat n=1 Tax=Cedratvirus lausannensis TaxID=2023205 RepID=A0A285PY16_9VIRU|nr:ankyrin repeat [Cedratvirus lausannensis]